MKEEDEVGEEKSRNQEVFHQIEVISCCKVLHD